MADEARIQKLAEELVALMRDRGIARMVAIFNVVKGEIEVLEKRFFEAVDHGGGGNLYPEIEHLADEVMEKVHELIAERHGDAAAAGGQLEVDAEYGNVRCEHAWEEHADLGDPEKLTVRHW